MQTRTQREHEADLKRIVEGVLAERLGEKSGRLGTSMPLGMHPVARRIAKPPVPRKPVVIDNEDRRNRGGDSGAGEVAHVGGPALSPVARRVPAPLTNEAPQKTRTSAGAGAGEVAFLGGPVIRPATSKQEQDEFEAWVASRTSKTRRPRRPVRANPGVPGGLGYLK